MRNKALVVGYILVVWFVISFVTNIIGPLMPLIISDFHLSLTLAGFLPFSFFLAYGVVSIPAGILIERIGPKPVLLGAFALNLAGALAFSRFPTYGVAVGALFVIGLGMAMLQVVINPLMRVAGGEQHFAFYSVMGQLVFGLASFVSPLVFASLMTGPGAKAFLAALPFHAHPQWVALYWLFAVIFAAVILVTLTMRIPPIELKDEEKAGALETYLGLLKSPHVVLFFLGIAAYVGTEQSLANWMSQFLATYHGVSPTAEGARSVGGFWGLMSVGCLIGLAALKLFDAKAVLVAISVLAIGCVAVALFGSREASLIAFPTCGFFLSAMFSIVFSLALNSVPRNHGALSGILCSGILGGAVVPLLVGALGEHIGLRAAMFAVFVTLGFILSIGFWARPLVRNETIAWRKAKAA
ncbi:MAG: MFS transporter [Caulobacter sp.]|nr:MFS transporter [Caulobacter sp.]